MVGIIMGSKSDEPIMQKQRPVLDELGVAYEMTVSSAHRNPNGRASMRERRKRAV